MPTQQETFDIIVAHLRRQGCRAGVKSDYGNIRCCYRTPDGLKCAVGILIPDDRYEPDMEGLVLRDNRKLKALVVDELGHSLYLCDRMQMNHDGDAVDNWEAGFRGVAHDFDLIYTPPGA